MKAFVMAGGFGTRLGALAKNIPKALLPVGNRPLLDHILTALEPVPGIDTIYVTTNKTFEPQFQKWLQNPSPIVERILPKITISTEPVVSEDHKLGAIGAWRHLIWNEKIQDDVLSVSGDNLFTFSLPRFVAFAKEKQAPSIITHTVSLTEATKFGVCSVDDAYRLLSFEEKPSEPQSTVVSTGIYFFPSRFLEYIDTYLSEGNNHDAPGHFLRWLYPQTSVYAFPLPGHWFDIGSPETFKRAQAFMNK